MTQTIFETVSFHIVKPCNAKCKFCYATFDDMHVKMMSLADACNVIYKLAQAGVQKITFAGGEPLLYPDINHVIAYAKDAGMTTGIITNGYLLTKKFLADNFVNLDWVGVSIDSTKADTQFKIGRVPKGRDAFKSGEYLSILGLAKKIGYKIKINTVVSSYNWNESLRPLIDNLDPDRWKILRALRIENQNDSQFNIVKVSDEQWKRFIDRNTYKMHPYMTAKTVIEDNNNMTGSYLLVDPQGRAFENSLGKHTYSDSLINHSVDHCLNQLKFDRSMFIQRGGIYKW